MVKTHKFSLEKQGLAGSFYRMPNKILEIRNALKQEKPSRPYLESGRIE